MFQIFYINIKYKETLLGFSNEESILTQLTKKYPVFNNEVERKINFKIPPFIKIFGKSNHLDQYILGEICCLKNLNLEIVYLKDIEVKKCHEDCKK